MPQKCFRAGVVCQVCKNRADREREDATEVLQSGCGVPGLPENRLGN